MMTPYGVREICDVVLKAKTNMKIGNRQFYKHEPVIYFDTLKTSTLEGAATTVYAQGGRGNSRLIAWEGERTVTFTMEDALISPAGFMILSGAGLIDATENAPVIVHAIETIYIDGKTNVGGAESAVSITLKETPYVDTASGEDYIYVMVLDDHGNTITEPYICEPDKDNKIKLVADHNYDGGIQNGVSVLVDYYVARKSGAQQINITPDKFGGNYYLEASTLFKTEAGVDVPAEFVIPNCKVQSNFTFTMASSGDPSTFTFTMDAFPDYTRFDKTHKVLAALQIVSNVDDDDTDDNRTATDDDTTADWTEA